MLYRNSNQHHSQHQLSTLVDSPTSSSPDNALVAAQADENELKLIRAFTNLDNTNVSYRAKSETAKTPAKRTSKAIQKIRRTLDHSLKQRITTTTNKTKQSPVPPSQSQRRRGARRVDFNEKQTESNVQKKNVKWVSTKEVMKTADDRFESTEAQY